MDHGTSGGADDAEEVGSLGVEALRLLHALHGWAQESGQDAAAAAASAGASAAAAAKDALRDVDSHISTGGPECQYCPVCQVISVVRGTSPEVRQHLRTAASSLMQAGAALLAEFSSAQVPRPEDRRRESAAEGIDVDDEWEDD